MEIVWFNMLTFAIGFVTGFLSCWLAHKWGSK